MATSLPRAALAQYVAKQFENFFPDGRRVDDVSDIVGVALDRTLNCFSSVRQKYYWKNDQADFNHLNSDHYAVFLYFLSNAAYKASNIEAASKAYLLNKTLHCVDIFYEIELPNIFVLQHPIGTVLGRAIYSDYLFVYQGCLVGAGIDGEMPRFNGPTVIFGDSKIVGACEIGANCWISLGTTLLDEQVPPDSVVRGTSPNLILTPAQRDVRRIMFGTDVSP
jgi:serine O-acetyltransferase